MSNDQIIVNTDAMETALNLLTEASTKLSLARDYYNSDKLSGTGLVTEMKNAIEKVYSVIGKSAEQLASINTGSLCNVPEENVYENNIADFSETYSETTKTSLFMQQTIDKLMSMSSNERISDFSKDGITCMTPDEYQEYLYSQLEDAKKGVNGYKEYNELKELERQVEVLSNAYRLQFDEAFLAETGKTYEEYMAIYDVTVFVEDRNTQFDNMVEDSMNSEIINEALDMEEMYRQLFDFSSPNRISDVTLDGVTCATPDEYRAYLMQEYTDIGEYTIGKEISQEELAEMNEKVKLADEYEKDFYANCILITGKTYSEFMQEYNLAILALQEDELNATLENIAPMLKLLEADIDEREEKLFQFLSPVGDEEDLLAGFASTSGPELGEIVLYQTPDEYLQELICSIDQISTPEYQAKKIAEYEELTAEYAEKFNAAFMEKFGMTYDQYMSELNAAKEVYATYRALRYQINQQLKEIPYLKASYSDVYIAFASRDDLDYTVLDEYEFMEYLSEEEKTMALYLYETEGLIAVEMYSTALQDKINKGKGEKEAQELLNKYIDENGNIDWKPLMSLDFWTEGFGDGVNNFLDGLINLCSEEGMRSDTQYKQMYIFETLSERGLLEELLGIAYQNGTSVGNMTIPMIASAITKQKMVGTLLMGMSAAGNAKNEALISGYSNVQSWIYGGLSGLSEAGLEYLLGAIPGLSASSGFTFDSICSEGMEEFIQSYVDAGFRSVCLGEEIDLSETTKEATKSFWMGVLTAFQLNGTSAIARSTVKIMYNGHHVELNLNDLTEYMKAHPDMKVSDAINAFMGAETCIDLYKDTGVSGDDLSGVNQAVFEILFSEKLVITPTIKSIMLDIYQNHKTELRAYIQNKHHNYSDAQVNILVNQIYTICTTQDSSLVNSCFSEIIKFFNLYLDEKIEVSSGGSKYANNADVIAIKNQIIDYFNSKSVVVNRQKSIYRW